MGDNRVPGIGSNVSWLARRWSRFAMNVRFCLSLFKVLCLVVECIGMVCCNSNRSIVERGIWVPVCVTIAIVYRGKRVDWMIEPGELPEPLCW